MARTTQQQTRSPTTFDVTSDREIRMERVFDAPVSVVYKAYTDAKQIPQWWGPRESTTKVDLLEVRKGGKWRFLNREGDQDEVAFRGVYREVVPNQRLVSTFEFEPQAGRISEDTAVFKDEAGKTRLTVTTRFANEEDRDGMLDQGMEKGARETWDRLGELVEKARRKPTAATGGRRRRDEEE